MDSVKTAVVPVSAVQRLILAADCYGVRYLDSDDMSDEAEELQAATEAMKDLIAAAPAPSPSEGAVVGELVEALDKAVVFTAFNVHDPLSVRLTFSTEEDRLAAAEAIDRARTEAATVRPTGGA